MAGFMVAAGQRLPLGMVVAVLVCLTGGLLIGSADLLRGSDALAGDGLALAGAAFAAAYFALGKGVRARASITTYIGIVYPVAAVALVGMALFGRQPLAGFDGRTWLMFVLLALVPQLLGHSALNWSLGYLSAPAVAIAVLGEPVIATMLAAVFLHEYPGPARIAGGAVVLLGVYLGLRAEYLAARPAAEPGGRSSGALLAPPL
jgi:drug/metabolite transporter (DMT)-like permease